VYKVDAQSSKLLSMEIGTMTTKEELVNQKIGKIIARKRKIAGYTQEETAEKLGIGTEAFSRIERGLVSPGILKLYELADLFQCGVESFLIEASRRPTDQTEYLTQMMLKLSAGDRQLIMTIIEKLSHRLGKKDGKTQIEDSENF
jgi:transcriptional regulator with XRE-family HTH domain